MHKIAIQTAPWFNEDDPMGSLSYIKACGFEAIDYNIDVLVPVNSLRKQQSWDCVLDRSDEALYEYFAPLKEAVEKTGVEICQMHAPFPLWLADKPELTEYVQRMTEQCIKVSAYVGCPAIVVHPITLQDSEKQWEINLALYRRLLPVAKKYGVKICLENMFQGFNGRMIEACCADATEAVAYIDTLNAEAGEDLFGFCLDVGHANLVGRNIGKYLKVLGHRLTILHIHDNDGRNDLHLFPYTCALVSGQVCDWEGFLAGLKEIGYQGELSFETFRGLMMMPKSVQDEALKLVAAIGRYFKDRLDHE